MINKKTALYRHYDSSGSLLYIGVSLSAINRLKQHQASAWIYTVSRVEIEYFSNRNEALYAEEVAIKLEKPKFNKHHNGSNSEARVYDSDTKMAVYYCTGKGCDVGDFFAPAMLKNKPPRCDECKSKSIFYSVYDK